MKILVISNFYPPCVFGGYELYAQAIVTGLRKLGHDVYVLTSQNTKNTEPQIYDMFPFKINNFYRTNQVNIFKKAFRFFFNPRNFAITKDVISKIKPDIISVWNLRLLSISPLIASTRSNRPLVLHLYDPWLLPLKIFKPFPWLRDNLLNVTHVITCAKSLACQYERAGIKKEYITVLPHGIAVYPRKAPDLTYGNGRRLLIISSLSKEKGIDVALNALAILINKKDKTNLSLNIYGEGDLSYRKTLGLIIKREGIEPYVHFNGWIKPELLSEVFARHDIFICPERWVTLPLILLQAMASEMPVIGMDYTGMHEVILDGVNGLLIPPDDADRLADVINRLDQNDSLRQDLGRKARETVNDRFNIEKDIRAIESYYLNLIKKNG